MSSVGSPKWLATGRVLLLVGALGLVAALVFTYPLVLRWNTSIPYATSVSPERTFEGLVPGDHLQFLYFLSITGDMVRGDVPLFEDPYEFSAPEPSRRKNYFFLPFSLLFVAFSPLGEASAYNLLLWLSFPATLLAVFFLARRLGLPMAAATVAGVGAMLLPSRVASAAVGHPSGFVLFLLPLAFVFLERAWQERSAPSAAGAGLTVVVLALNEPHYLYFFGFLLVFWLGTVFWREAPGSPTTPAARGLLDLVPAALGPAVVYAVWSSRRYGIGWDATSLVLLLGFFWLLLACAWLVGGGIRSRARDPDWRGEARSWWPLVLLCLYGMQTLGDVPYLGRVVFLGVAVLLVLAKRRLLAAIVTVSRSAEVREAAWRLVGLWPLVVGLGAAAAIVLHYKSGFIDPSGAEAGRPLREVALFSPKPADFLDRSSTVLTRRLYPGLLVVVLAVIGASQARARVLWIVALVSGGLALGLGAPRWLPLYPIAYETVPYFDMIRQPAKFFAVAGVVLALAAGFGFWALVGRRKPLIRAGLATLVVAGIAVDFSSVLPLGLSHLPEENRVYSIVRQEAKGTNLLELPLWPGDSAFSSIYQYWARLTKVPVVNGYSPTTPADYVERVVVPLSSMNLGELTREQLELLGDLGVRYVTIHRDTFPPQVSAYPYRYTLEAMRKNPNLRFVASDDGVFLFDVARTYEPWDPAVPWKSGQLFEAERLKAGTGWVVEARGASGNASVRGAEGGAAPMPVFYGPYQPFPRGRYEARFRVRGRGRVDVAAEKGRRVLEVAPVDAPDFVEVVAPYRLEAPETLEFRAWAAEGDEIEADWVHVTKVDGEGPTAFEPDRIRFEAEDLRAVSGMELEDEGASAGSVAQIVPGPAGRLVRDGPWVLVDPGDFRVVVRSRRGPARLRIESADGVRSFGQLELPAREGWGDTEASVHLDDRVVLCLRLVGLGEPGEIDYIDLERVR